jgi:hypothetical protein
VTGVIPPRLTISNDLGVPGRESLLSTLFIIWLIIAVISIAAYFISNANTDPEEDEDEQEKYLAVIIVFDEAEACPSVKELAGQRLLSNQAPLLPLVDCTSRECACTYRHYVDRRGGSRRIDEKSVVKKCYGGGEKRLQQRGRRSADLMEDTFEQTQDPTFDTHADTYYDYVDRTGLMKAMANKEAEELAAESSDQASPDLASSDQDNVASIEPATTRVDAATVSPGEKKSGQSRS